MKEREIYYKIAYFQKNILKHIHTVTHNIKVYQKRYNSGLRLDGNSSCERNVTFHFQVLHELLLRKWVIPIFLNWHNFRTNERILTCKRLKFIRKKFLIDWSTYQCCNLNSFASTRKWLLISKWTIANKIQVYPRVQFFMSFQKICIYMTFFHVSKIQFLCLVRHSKLDILLYSYIRLRIWTF